MKRIVFPNDEKKVNSYNEYRADFYRKNPEYSDEYKPIEDINDVFTPYSCFLSELSEEEKNHYGIIIDSNNDFNGFYITYNFNDHYKINELTQFCEVDNLFDYGVVDNASQIIENCNIPDDCVILMTPVIKDEDAPNEGWRWHKWGPYYGVQNHMCEYLNDEPDVNMIYCFRIVKLKLSDKEVLERIYL